MPDTKLTLENLPEPVALLTEQVLEIRKLVELLTQPVNDIKNDAPISINEACEILMKAKSTIYKLARKGEIPSYKQGKTLYFYEHELLEWIDKGQEVSVGITQKAIANYLSNSKTKPVQTKYRNRLKL